MDGRAGIYGVLAILIMIWGSTWSVIRIGLEGIPPLTGVSARFAIAGVLLLGLGRALGVAWPKGRTIRRLWWIETVFGFVLSYGVVYWAEQWVPSGLAAVLFSTFPIFVAVVAHFWLADEPLRATALAGLAIGVAGIAVIFSEDLTALAGPGVVTAAAVVLISPAAGAVSHVAVKKWGRAFHPIHLASVPMLATSAVMAVGALLFERGRAVVLDTRSIGALLYLALLGSVVTFTLYYWLLARLPATRLSLMTYALPIVALAIGTFIFDEPRSARTFAGSGMVVLGVALAGTTRRAQVPLDDLPQRGNN